MNRQEFIDAIFDLALKAKTQDKYELYEDIKIYVDRYTKQFQDSLEINLLNAIKWNQLKKN